MEANAKVFAKIASTIKAAGVSYNMDFAGTWLTVLGVIEENRSFTKGYVRRSLRRRLEEDISAYSEGPRGS